MAEIKCEHCGTINSSKDFYCKNDECQKNLHTGTHEVDEAKKNNKGKPKKIQEVKVIDFNMSFGSMVMFMVKWVIASIPAMIILFFIWMALMMIFGGSVVGLMNI